MPMYIGQAVREKLNSHMPYANIEQTKNERSVEVVSNRKHTRLVHVAELRVSVSEILDLSSGLADQAVVSPAHITLLVLPLAVADTKYGENTDATLTNQVDGVADWVSWRVSTCVGPSRENTSSGTQCDNVSSRDGADSRAGRIVRRPRKETRTSGKCTNGDQEDTAVSDVRVGRPSHDREARNGRERKDSEVNTTAVRLV